METRANHVLIGLFTLAVALFAVLFALWAAKYSSEKNWTEYDIVFAEAVTGLSNGGVVQYNGINVGEVRKLSLDPRDPNKVIARVRLESGTPVKIDTKAKLAIVGLATGVAEIQLTGGSVSSPMLMPKGGEKVGTIYAEESSIGKLLSSTEDITTTAADVLLRLNRVLSDENVRHITLTLDHLDAVTGSLSQEGGDLRVLLKNARQAAEKLDTTLAHTDSVVTGLDKNLVAQLPPLVAKLDKSLDHFESLTRNADALVGNNSESLSNFSSQGLTQVGPTLNELRRLLRDIDQLSERLENNPAGFVLGHGKPKEFKP
jgi:phospholipid/cholesterol/gamma-HCH transport system substrate-binding protein